VHESAEPDEDEEGATGLPRRRRGKTLAEAERRSAPQPAEPRPVAATEDARVRAARFNSFRQAVRPSSADSADAPGTPDPADAVTVPNTSTPVHDAVPAPHPESGSEPPSHQHAHPEGDTTS
jgi:hypothetical protein